MQPTGGKPDPTDINRDPDKLALLLDIELMQKRAEWKRAAAARQSLRVGAVLFLLVVIAGAIAAYFFYMADAPTPRSNAPATQEATRP